MQISRSRPRLITRLKSHGAVIRLVRLARRLPLSVLEWPIPQQQMERVRRARYKLQLITRTTARLIGICHQKTNLTSCASMREHAKAKLRAKVRGPLVLVFRLASIGVRLRTAPAPRGAGVSSLALRTSASRPTRTTCVRCGLFNYLTIRLFCFRFFGDGRGCYAGV